MPSPVAASTPPEVPATAAGNRFRALAPWLGALVIVGAGLLAYRNSLTGPFVFDDAASITDNPTIRHLWPISDVLRPPRGGGITVESRPVLNLSLALNYAISGTEVGSYRATNLLIHLLAGLTLFGIVRRTLVKWSARTLAGAPENGAVQCVANHALHLALLIAVLWTIHPLQTESVTYVIQRAESLMGLFYLLTLYCFTRGAEADDVAAAAPARVPAVWFGLSWLVCALGMGTKEVMATAPILVLLYDRTFFAGTVSAAWRRRWRYHLALASTWILLAALVLASGGNRSGTLGPGAAPWFAHLLTQFPALAHYLWLSFWPHPLVFYYPTFWVEHPLEVLPQIVLVLVLLAGTVSALRSRPAVGFLGAWFFLILAPTSLAPASSQMLAEHRMYLPLAAVLVLAVVGVTLPMASPLGRRLRGGLPLLAFFGWSVALAWGILTFGRNAAYATHLSLWSATNADSSGNIVARDNLGLALSETGRYAEAIPQFEAALQLKPDYAEAHNNLGIVLAETGQTAKAMEHFAAALRIKPSYAAAHGNFGLALQGLGRLPEAIEQFQAALRLAPADPRNHFNLGYALRLSGRNAEAILPLRDALQIKPDYLEAQKNLGLALRDAGQIPEAVAQFQAILRLTPDDAVVRLNLGSALYASGRPAEAIAEFRRAVAIEPGFAEAHNNLGVALRATGRDDDAIREFRAALLIKPEFASAEINLGRALGAMDRIPEAIESFQRALRLDPRNADARYDLAMALRAAGREAEAKSQFDQAAQLGAGKTPAR